MSTSDRLRRCALYSFAVSMTLLIGAAILDLETTPVSMATGLMAAPGGVAGVLMLMVASIVGVIGAGVRAAQHAEGTR